MFLLTRKTDYALVAMSDLARRPFELASAREIAERSRVPLPVLTNILHALARYGLVVSARGVKGGYRLARPAEDITLADVIEAIEGPARLTVCAASSLEGADRRCRLESVCAIRGPALKVHRRLREFLSQVTLAEIAFEAEPCEMEPCGVTYDAYGDECDRGAGESPVSLRVRDGY